jgi:three-Cys-motif partner protein
VTTDDFFERRREWSRWKHRLLQHYLAQFAPIVGSTHRTVYYIDGFAGEGRYKNPREDGSPVIAARIAIQTPPGRPYTLRCINIEPEYFDALTASTAEFGPSIVDNRKGTFRDNLGSVLTTIGTTDPALFFLDPMGHVGMEWDVVMRIVERARSAITDVMLNFYITNIDRHAGFLNSKQPFAPEFVKRLDALFGTDEWQAICASTPIQEDRILKLSDLYMDRLLSAFAKVSRGPGPVAARYPVTTLEGRLKYFIMFGSRHPRGGRAMSEAVFRVTTEHEDAKANAKRAALEARGQMSFLPPETPPSELEIDDSIVAELAPAILLMAPRGKPLSLVEIEVYLLSDWFGRAVEKHYRRACIRLVEEHKMKLLKAAPSKRSSHTAITKNDKLVIL